MEKSVKISSSIPEDHKMAVESWVKRGAFESQADFYRTAIRRLLGEMESYREKKVEEKKKKIQDDAKELRDMVDGLF